MDIQPTEIKKEQIQKHLKKIYEYESKIEELYKTDLGSQYNFLSCIDLFKYIFDLAHRIENLDFSKLPLSYSSAIEEALENVLSTLAEIRSLKLENISNNLKGNHQQKISELNNRYQSLIEAIVPAYNINSLFSDITNPIHEKAKMLFEDIQGNSTDIQKAKDDIFKVLEDIQSAAAKGGASKYSTIFHEQYQKHEESAKYWLWGMGAALGAIIGTGVLLWIFDNPVSQDVSSIVHFAFIRIVLLTVLFYSLNVCSKNYKSHKHNSIVNKHRANALNTFRVFVDAAKDDEDTKNAVLLEATRTIFSSQQTAYLNNENEAESPIKIIELIKSGKTQ